MKFFRLDLLTLLISLFILTGCKNQDPIGLGVNSSNQVNGSLVDTSTIIVNTVYDDSVVTSGPLGKTPLGYFNDPLFGTTQADVATDLNLPSLSSFTLPSGTITVDSASLILHWVDGFYGDSLASKYKINVYQLQKKFNTDTAYYNTKYFGTYSSSPLLGTRTFTSKTHDSVQIYNKVSGTAAALLKVGPEVRIPISTDFINRSFFNAGSLALGSNAIFQTNLRGLYITLDKMGTTGAGGVFMIAPADTLAIFYKATNGTTVDTSSVLLPIAHLASKITHTYSTTILNAIGNTKTSGSVFYLQGLGGLRAKVSFPSLLMNLRKSLLAAGNDMVLNRAELVVTAVPGSDIPYVPLPKISLYKLDIAHQRTELEDASSADARSGGVAVFGGFYSMTSRQYHFIVTAYLQDLLLNKTVDYGTYIAPVDTTNTASVDIAATPQVAARTAAVGSNATSPYRIRLNIIYTIIKKGQ